MSVLSCGVIEVNNAFLFFLVSRSHQVLRGAREKLEVRTMFNCYKTKQKFSEGPAQEIRDWCLWEEGCVDPANPAKIDDSHCFLTGSSANKKRTEIKPLQIM